MKRHSLLFALFIFLSSLSMQAEETAGKWSERYNVTAITMDEGLPHNFVDDILKDSQGFLWIATRGEGIARYDGYEFTAFNMGSTHTKLRSNFINKLCEDNFKRIWAVSEMGIDILDIQTMQTVQVADTKDKLISLCNRPSHLILHSKAGNIWVCSENNLFKITFDKQGNISQLIKICEVPAGESIRTICEVEDYLWINYKDGIYRIKESAMEVVVKAWATEGHSVAVPGLGTMRFGLQAGAVTKVEDVSAGLITTRKVIFTPSTNIKQELKDTSVNITCYDKDGNVIKQVSSSDPGNVDDGGDNTGGDGGIEDDPLG